MHGERCIWCGNYSALNERTTAHTRESSRGEIIINLPARWSASGEESACRGRWVPIRELQRRRRDVFLACSGIISEICRWQTPSLLCTRNWRRLPPAASEGIIALLARRYTPAAASSSSLPTINIWGAAGHDKGHTARALTLAPRCSV